MPMGAGRGKRRRVWRASGSGRPGARFRLDALPRRHPRYARYVEVLYVRAHDGTAFRFYWVEEYARSGNPTPINRYGVVVDERDSFWVAAAPSLASHSPETHEDDHDIAPLARATYRRMRKGYGLRELDGRECVVYVVEQLRGDHGLHVPSRCGVRFVGDDSYWVVPAIELDIGPLAGAA